MVPRLAIFLGALTLALPFTVSTVDACQRGLGWATNNNYSPTVGNGPLISWYLHWQDGIVPQMPSKVEYVPMFWGASKWSSWQQRVAEMNKKTPQHLMAFNEPEISGQANMSPAYAAKVYMQEIFPWSKKGVRLGSPAIVYDLKWMDAFLQAIQQQGGHVDFICCHWYGHWNNIAGFKTWVQTVHSRYGKNVWVTEVGVTSASNPTQAEDKSFMMNAFSFLDSQSYVERGAWFGVWESNKPPDSYSSRMNALLQPGGKLNDMGNWYVNTQNPVKRLIRSHTNILAARNATKGDDFCDYLCELRNEQIAYHLASFPASP